MDAFIHTPTYIYKVCIGKYNTHLLTIYNLSISSIDFETIKIDWLRQNIFWEACFPLRGCSFLNKFTICSSCPRQIILILMLLVANNANKNDAKKLKNDWNPGSWVPI